MLENIIIWLKTPLGEEISLSLLLSLISSVLILWGISKLFKFKKDNFLTALWVGSLFTLTNFLIRLINLIFNLPDAQKPTANIIGMIVSSIVLIILLIIAYKANWWKTILSWMAVFYGKFLFMGIVMVIVMFSFPAFMEFDSAPTAKVGIADFSINDVGEKTGDNQFVVYRSKVINPTGFSAIILGSSVAFNTRVENVEMDLQCFTTEGESISIGDAHFDCIEVCTKDRTTFNMKGLFNKSIEYATKSKLAELYPDKFSGTKILYVERRKPIGIYIDLRFSKDYNTIINCNIDVIAENPPQTIEKSFTIDYIAKDIECKDYTKLGSYVPGEVIVDFSQDASKEQVESLLSLYNLPSDQIEFPERFSFRVDFEGDEEGFVDFLEQNNFIKTGNPHIFEARSFEYAGCKDAKTIFHSYPNISIDYIHCFDRIHGLVKVPEGEEDKWICELNQNDIVINANLNKVGSITN